MVRASGAGSSDSGWGPVAGSCKRDNEPMPYVRDEGFIEYFGSYLFLRKESTAGS